LHVPFNCVSERSACLCRLFVGVASYRFQKEGYEEHAPEWEEEAVLRHRELWELPPVPEDQECEQAYEHGYYYIGDVFYRAFFVDVACDWVNHPYYA